MSTLLGRLRGPDGPAGKNGTPGARGARGIIGDGRVVTVGQVTVTPDTNNGFFSATFETPFDEVPALFPWYQAVSPGGHVVLASVTKTGFSGKVYIHLGPGVNSIRNGTMTINYAAEVPVP